MRKSRQIEFAAAKPEQPDLHALQEVEQLGIELRGDDLIPAISSNELFGVDLQGQSPSEAASRVRFLDRLRQAYKIAPLEMLHGDGIGDAETSSPTARAGLVQRAVKNFRSRMRRERLMTERNNVYHIPLAASLSELPEEYFDYCFVFHSHPIDVQLEGSLRDAKPETARRVPSTEEPLLAVNTEGTPQAKALFDRLSAIRLSPAEIRNYLASVCVYRDLVQIGPSKEPNARATFFSSFSMSVHHGPDSHRMISTDPKVRKVLTTVFGASATMEESSSGSEADVVDPVRTRATEGSAELSLESASTPLSKRPKLLSPPLALIIGDDSDPGMAQLVASAGADSLPSFYGLTEFLTLLRHKPSDFTLSALELGFIVREMFTSCLRKFGADLHEFLSVDQTALIVKVRLREAAARRVASHLEYVCQCDFDACGYDFLKENPLYIPPYLSFDENAEDVGSGGAYRAASGGRKIWRRFDGLGREVLCRVDAARKEANPEIESDIAYASLFRDTDRIRLLSYIVDFHFNVDALQQPSEAFLKKFRTTNNPNEPIQFDKLGQTFSSATPIPPLLLSHFPLHKRHVQRTLCRDWATMTKVLSVAQPLDRIRDYFGEQVAFYFLWTGYLTQSLRWPSFIGVLVFLIQICLRPIGRYDSATIVIATAAYALYMVVWSSKFSIAWSREEQYWRLRWGMEQERLSARLERPSFIFDYYIVDPLNPRRFIKYYSPTKTKLRALGSALATLVSLSAIVLCVVLIYYLQVAFTGLPGNLHFLEDNKPLIMSSAQALQIVLFDFVWCTAVRWFTSFENHRLERDHLRSVIAKMFLFRFMNNFYALLYIAFARNIVQPCSTASEGGCLRYFQLQLGVLYILLLLFNLIELGVPLSYFWSKQRKAIHGGTISDFVEVQSYQQPYEPALLVEDYMEIVVQFCAVVFFSVALPIVPLLAYLQNLIEIRSDAYKLTLIQQRAFPHLAPEGLATYNDIIALIGLVSAPVTVALCIFLIPFGSEPLPLKLTLLYFLIAEHFLILVRVYLQFNSTATDSKVEAIKESMRLATHEIVWGDANYIQYADVQEATIEMKLSSVEEMDAKLD